MKRMGSLVPFPTGLLDCSTWVSSAPRRLDLIILTITAKAREQGRPGRLSLMLLHAQDEESGRRMTDELRDEAMTLSMAGHETWRQNTLARAWASNDPRCEERRTPSSTRSGWCCACADRPAKAALYRHDHHRDAGVDPTVWMVAASRSKWSSWRSPIPAGTTVACPRTITAIPAGSTPELFRPEPGKRPAGKAAAIRYFPFGGGPGSASATSSHSWKRPSCWRQLPALPSSARPRRQSHADALDDAAARTRSEGGGEEAVIEGLGLRRSVLSAKMLLVHHLDHRD